MRDVEFLALLVHRGHLARSDAEALLDELKGNAETGSGDGDLDGMLVERLGWTPAHLARLRRTRAGELPEIPGYDVKERIGTGGTADVFRAREKKTNRGMALKVLKREQTLHAPTRKGFIAEARLLERLDHPGLVKGYGVARSGNTFFSRMQIVEGKTLLEMLDAGESFSEEAALRITLETAEVMRYLEDEGVVHRDVKPGNIMLDAKGRVVLIDLGFATPGEDEPDPQENDKETTIGTVAYLSPEQARGQCAADARSDIYSLGISLFHIVCGRLPFDSSDDREVLRMQVMDSLSSPELKSRRLSPHLHYFIEKMVAKEADHRYQTWCELIDDVRAQLTGREDLDFEKDARRNLR